MHLKRVNSYPFNYDKFDGLWYLDTEAHYENESDFEKINNMEIGEVITRRGLAWEYMIKANSFDEAYKLINEWIKNNEN